MSIQPVKPESIATNKPAVSPIKREKPAAAPRLDEFKSEKMDSLLKSLESEPDARPEMVERATELARDADYPSPEMLAKLADLFLNDAKRPK